MEALGYSEEPVRDVISLDLIQKAMKSLRINDHEWWVQVRRTNPAFSGRVYVNSKDTMRKALAGLQKLGFEVQNPDYAHFNFIVQH